MQATTHARPALFAVPTSAAIDIGTRRPVGGVSTRRATRPPHTGITAVPAPVPQRRGTCWPMPGAALAARSARQTRPTGTPPLTSPRCVPGPRCSPRVRGRCAAAEAVSGS